MRECEEMGIQAGWWRELPSMTYARCLFNPCDYNGFLYLCGFGTDAIEAYSPEACIFLPLQVLLPEKSACIAVVDNNQLLIVSTNYLTRWTTGQNHSLVLCSLQNHANISVLCNMPPVLDPQNGRMYISDEGKCNIVSLDGSERTVVE